jgi:hypothetical protein
MLRGIYLFRFFHRAVVQPENNVVVILYGGELRPGDGDGLISVVGEDGKGTGCVEPDTTD